jgi:sugar (pentulose or hexulose) kinase
MKKNYLLGIDVGTTVVKSVIFDFEGNEIAKASYDTKIIHSKPGWAEQNMIEVWEAVAASIKKAIKGSTIESGEIKGISLCAQGGGTWLVDKKGEPVRNAISWLDGRAGYIIDRWHENGTINKLLEASGLVYYPGASPGVIFPWLIENDPNVLEESETLLWSKDWVRYCLTGEKMTDETDPSHGMLNPNDRNYSNLVLELTGTKHFKALLPEIKKSHEIGGRITEYAARKTGLKKGTPVAVGAWDVASTALGQGCVDINDAFSIIGTAGIHMLVIDKPIINKSYSLSCHTIPDLYLVNSMAMTATNNLDWFIKEFCFEEFKKAEKEQVNIYKLIDKKVSRVSIGANGIFYLPFLQGERAPFVEPRARGEFIGLGDWTIKEDFLRAIFEGVALSTLHNYKSIQKAGNFEKVRLGGGGSNSDVWAQIISDCTGKVMEVTSGGEYGARGAAINAALMLGIYSNHKEAVKNMVRIKKTYIPNLNNTDIYKQMFDIYVKLINSHMQLWREMGELVVVPK